MSISTGALLPRGVIVEFDFAVLPGHRLMLDLYAARLAKDGVELDAARAARYLWGKSFSSGLNALCNRQQKTVDVPGVIAECNEAFSAALKEELAKVPAGFTAFVGALLAKGMKVVLLTRVDTEAVRAAFASVATESLVVMHDASSGFGFFGWDGWRRASRKNDLYERLSVAVAGSGCSVKGALTAGLGVLVKDSPEVAYQDVSGSDVRVVEYAASLADEVRRILRV